MSKGELKDIVPPLELCRMIPAGKFEDSALVWTNYRWDGWIVAPRTCAGEIPAPTLAEILEEIDPSFDANITVTYHFGQWKVEHRHYPREGVGSDNDNPATAALKLFLGMEAHR